MKFDKWSTKFGNVQKLAKEYIRPVTEEAESLGRKLTDEVRELCDNPDEALDRTTTAAKRYADKGKQVAQSLSEKAESSIREPRESWGKFVESTEQVAEEMSDGLSKTASDISDGIKGVFIPNDQYVFYERARVYQGTYIEKLLRTKPAFDTTVVMGESLTQFLSTGIYNSDIIQAYEMAYPNLSAEVSLAERVASLSDEQVVGLVNGIKGKLFELQYVDLLNSELLPDGAFARLSESATEPGWDIQIVDTHGAEIEVLQAKATASVYYVQQALEKYPNIDVVTTEETFLKLAEMGVAEGLIDSGISNSELQSYVDGSMQGSDGVLFDHVPVLSLAVVAFTSYDEMGNFDVIDFTHRGCQAYITYLISLGVMSASGVWFMGPLASIGVMGLLERYREKYRDLSKIHSSFMSNEAYIRRVEQC